MLQRLVEASRIKQGRNPLPSYSLIDSQSVKTSGAAKGRGIDGGKKVKGRKRHIVTDTQGHLLHVTTHPANEHDSISGCLVFEEALDKYPSLKGVVQMAVIGEPLWIMSALPWNASLKLS